MGDVSYINKVLEQFKEAVELITRALEIDEKCEFVYETLGTIEVQRGNLRQGQYLAAAD